MNEDGLAAPPLADAVLRIERQPLAERIAEQVRRLILVESLPPAAVITEREMAAMLGVSRTPLREALRILAGEGLVEIAPHRRPRVADPSIAEILQLLVVQGALEGLAGAIACQKATDVQLADIAALHAEMVKISDNSDPLDFFDLDMAFHKKIVAASENVPLLRTHAEYNARLYRARFISSRRPDGRPTTLDQHREVAEALIARDANRARAALRAHLQSTGINITAAHNQTIARAAGAHSTPLVPQGKDDGSTDLSYSRHGWDSVGRCSVSA
jgi:GntR family transcriptional regulator, rspAB operon transcriptional repressor